MAANYPSPKMTDAFRLRAKGLRQSEIAKELGVYDSTVKSWFRRYTEDDAVVDQTAIARAASGNRWEFEALRPLEVNEFWNVAAQRAASTEPEFVEGGDSGGGAWSNPYVTLLAECLGLERRKVSDMIQKRQRKAA